MAHRLMRMAKARLVRFEETHPPVLIMGLRRGGSSMLADTISANRGVWFADEPYAMFPGRSGYDEKTSHLFVPKHSHFFGLSAQEEAQFDAFSRDLLKARFRSMGTARRVLWGFRSNRTSLKILNAPWMLPWFASETEAHIIALIRHPGAQARSVLRQGWSFPVEAYLERQGFLEQTFSAEQIAEAQRLWQTGNLWQKAILDWVVTSNPLRNAVGERVHRTTYENIVSAPDAFIENVLIKACGLNDREAMNKAILRPSGSSRLNTPSATRSIVERNVNEILNRWRINCSDDQLVQGQEILDCFKVTEYDFMR